MLEVLVVVEGPPPLKPKTLKLGKPEINKQLQMLLNQHLRELLRRGLVMSSKLPNNLAKIRQQRIGKFAVKLLLTVLLKAVKRLAKQ
jgi:hypothetical protein